MLSDVRLLAGDDLLSAGALAGRFRKAGTKEAIRWFREAAAAASSAAQSVSPGPHSWLARLRWARINHTLGSAALSARLPGLAADARRLQEEAFEIIGRTIVAEPGRRPVYPRNALRSDEIVWGRAAVRLDLGGGWTDTPPYSLERGGRVINAAVDLNGQPPIHVYARVIDSLEIRIASIDHGSGLRIRELPELLDYRNPSSGFGLAKAALVLAGFSPERSRWPSNVKTLRDMLRAFGGGLEITTLAAIPSGSGLGTSSVMGAVLAAVIQRLVGREPAPAELFHRVLQIEQELTTGGGWQDQVGGVLPGVKMITTEPGLVPNPLVHYVPADVLDPRTNGGTTLLYYTGIRRLAKNILRTVVGRYLDRDEAVIKTLAEIHAFPPLMVEAMSRKDSPRSGELIDLAWRLNKKLDPDSTTAEIEAILARIRRRIHGAKLLGAGGGGFLLIACRSQADAARVRDVLEKHPPNPRARFFSYEIASRGLQVTVC